VFQVATAPVIAPTIELTVHFRGTLPASGDWVLGEFESRVARDGFFEEDGLLWSRDGELLAQSRQLALAIAPPTG
jgi:acyl-CoA thioesterase